MKKLIFIAFTILVASWTEAQIIADHTAVDKYDQIPQQYMDAVKSMLVSIPGESHSLAYRLGLELLEDMDNDYLVEIYDLGTPPAQSTENLRIGRHMIAGEDIFFSQSGVAGIEDDITDQNNTGNPFDVMGFGWCWDMTLGDDPGGTEDPVYQVRWAGRSEGSPDGSGRWGLDAEDEALTGNSVSMDTYLEAVETFNQHSIDNAYPTKWIYTTGPVDRPEHAGTENGFQREIKHDYIRTHVAADAGRVLFDYADILCWNNDGEQYLSDWNDGGTIRTHAQIHPDNMMDYNSSWDLIAHSEDGDHIGEVGTVRLAKAMWWMLARMAGWDGVEVILVSEIEVSAEDQSTEVMTGDELQFLAAISPENASNQEVDWSIINGTGTASISALGLLSAGSPGSVQVVALAMDGSGVGDTLDFMISDPLVPVSSISITTAGGAEEILFGATLSCSASVLPADASNPAIIWSVINGTGSATVSSAGLVRGLSAGTVDLIATAEDGSGVADTIELTVLDEILVTDIEIHSEGEVSQLSQGEELQMSVTVLPADASNPEVDWTVNNGTGSATISSTGRLTSLSAGNVTVVATAQDPSGVSDSFPLTILAPEILVESITVSSDGNVSTLESGETLQFFAYVLPIDANNRDVEWSVVDGSGSASISSNGLLSAGAPGSVAVVASALDGSGVTGNFYLDITSPQVLVESIAVVSAGGVSSVESGSTLQFSAAVYPADASNKSIQWSIANGTGSALISETGLLTAGNPGSVLVVASALDGSGVSGEFSLNIIPPPVPVSSITISSVGGKTEVSSGAALQFHAAVLPENASNKSIGWSIQEVSGTASIDDQGLLTAGNPGTVNVIASAQDGSGISSSFSLTISSPGVEVSSIDIISPGGTSVVGVGGMLQLSVDVNPSDASNSEVYWHVTNTAQNSGSGSITPDGMFIALEEGDVDIVAVAQDGSGVFDLITLTVMGPSSTGAFESGEFSLYPNPGDGLFYLNLEELHGGKLKVINAMGAVVYEYVFEAGIQVMELDLSRQQPGIYYVQVFSGAYFMVKPIILSR